MALQAFKPIPAARVYFPPGDIDDLANEIKEILRSGQLTLGPHTEMFEQQFAATHLRTHGILQELRGRKATLLHQLVEIVWKVDLHARHTPNCTPTAPPHAGDPPRAHSESGSSAIRTVRT